MGPPGLGVESPEDSRKKPKGQDEGKAQPEGGTSREVHHDEVEFCAGSAEHLLKGLKK